DATAIAPGTVVDTRNGVLELTTAVAGGVQTARFWGGRFEIRQPRGGAGMTELVLRGAMPPCRKAARSSRGRAPRLWGSDSHGRFRTRGKSSVATVRGTKWLTEETCAGTRTRVVEGAVSVRNLRSRKTALVRAGGTYTAR
ncbi:MAG: hypothetical protein HZB46_07455, partial [Solirubrobacterales bacterium]|nr:hypothetical protein [Solirubrobacterales bacterium]